MAVVLAAVACSTPRPSTVGPLPRFGGGREGNYCTDASARWRCRSDLFCDLGICKSPAIQLEPVAFDAGSDQPDGGDEN